MLLFLSKIFRPVREINRRLLGEKCGYCESFAFLTHLIIKILTLCVLIPIVYVCLRLHFKGTCPGTIEVLNKRFPPFIRLLSPSLSMLSQSMWLPSLTFSSLCVAVKVCLTQLSGEGRRETTARNCDHLPVYFLHHGPTKWLFATVLTNFGVSLSRLEITECPPKGLRTRFH